jgi:RNA polymerase sigma-70 factor (ECF subfamily)
LGKLDNIYELLLLERLKQSDKTAFSVLFTAYYSDLVVFASSYLKDIHVAEEIVQDVFVKIWDDRAALDIKTSLKSYLLRTVHNKSIDWRRHLAVRDKYSADIKENTTIFDYDPEHYLLGSEVQQIIDSVISKLPSDVAETFRMNRYDGLKYHEIAEKLQVSVRTIEVRIGKALQMLREHLKDYLVVLLVFL